MHAWGKWAFAAAAPLFLASCLWSPGRFTSDLAVRKNGTFTLDYRGEILLRLPDDSEKAAEPWADSMAVCYEDGRTGTDAASSAASDDEDIRTCTSAEIADLKAEYEKTAAERGTKKRKEAEDMAKLFGIPGSDDESNRRFAANLMKYKGWRTVRYKGTGLFDVDYHFEGRTDQDFAFPLMPDSDLMIPFITIRRRADGTVLVSAPALTGGTGPFGARAKAMGLPDQGGSGPVSKAEGRFTIVTDGEVLTNNSEDGPSPHPNGRQVHWDVGPVASKVPEMLIRL